MKVCRVCGCCYDDSESVCPNDGSTPLVADRAGDTLVAGKYRLVRLLGRGGVGAVYAARHLDLEIPVAVKLLLPTLTDDPAALARFRREAQAAARLHHPGIARTHDFGILADGGAYLVMELVEGPTLRQIIADRAPLGACEATRIARQVLEAIDTAHHAGIIHRDLKPSNIIVSIDHRDHQRAMVVDFGLAKVLEEAMTLQGGITTTGTFIGTPRYMSPEQCQGEDLDPRSDIYSLGVILYEMLAGRPPFESPSLTALALKHLQEPPPPIRASRPDLPDDLVKAIEDALAKSRDDRPATAGELAARLRAIELRLAPAGEVESVPVIAAPPTPIDTTGPDTIARQQKTISGPPLSEPQAPRTIDPVVPGVRLSPETTFVTPDEPPPSKRSPLVTIAAIALLFLLGLTGWWLLQREKEPGVATSQERTGPAIVDENDRDTLRPEERASSSPKREGSVRSTATNIVAEAPAIDRGATTDALREGIARWVLTMNTRNVDGHIATYDSRLSTFYLQHDVDRAQVRQVKAQLFREASKVRITTGAINLLISRDGRTATMRFPKSYTITSRDSVRSGEVLSELVWKRTDSGWRITSERDLRVMR